MLNMPIVLLIISYVLVLFIPILFYIFKLRSDQIDLEEKIRVLSREKSELEGKLMLKDEEIRAYNTLFRNKQKNNYESVMKRC